MGQVQLQALKSFSIEEAGTARRLRAGDWFYTGKHFARILIGDGRACIPRPDVQAEVFCIANAYLAVGNPFMITGPKHDYITIVSLDEIPQDASTVCIWRGQNGIIYPAVMAGLTLLDDPAVSDGYKWDILAMITGREKWLKDFGNEETCAQTVELIHDLRVPAYNPLVLWLRLSPSGWRFLEKFLRDIEAGIEHHHAFARALYCTRLRVYTLPSDWHTRHVQWK